MRALKYILLIVLIFIIGSSIYIATLEANYDIKRSRTIKVPVEVIFEEINDFKNWKNWGPWIEMDSTIIATYPEITNGVGASYSWTGKEGTGSMKTISVIPNKEIIQQIDFGSGSTPEVYWEFNEIENGTEVTWGMRGKNSFSEKLYWLFNDGIEKNMNPMYDRGLELLDIHLTKQMEIHSFNFKGVVDYGGGFYLYQTTSCKMDMVDDKMENMFNNVTQFMAENTIEIYGNPFILYHKWDEANNTTMFSTCMPVNERIITTGDVLTGFMEPVKTFKTVFTGDYKFSNEAWVAAYKEIANQGIIALENGESFEIFKIRPHDTANPTKWVTEIYVPIN
jgi:uncharacterized protein YndB with AHSA1/START domain